MIRFYVCVCLKKVKMDCNGIWLQKTPKYEAEVSDREEEETWGVSIEKEKLWGNKWLFTNNVKLMEMIGDDIQTKRLDQGLD